jgi:hypothetical protein
MNIICRRPNNFTGAEIFLSKNSFAGTQQTKK